MAIKKITLILGLWVSMSAALAQPGGGPGGGGDPGHGKPVPISGIEILIGAGVLLGTRRLLALRNKGNSNE